LSNRTFSKTAGLVAGGLPVAGYVDRIPEPVVSVSNAAHDWDCGRGRGRDRERNDD
jgi:hypothetical protein